MHIFFCKYNPTKLSLRTLVVVRSAESTTFCGKLLSLYAQRHSVALFVRPKSLKSNFQRISPILYASRERLRFNISNNSLLQNNECFKPSGRVLLLVNKKQTFEFDKLSPEYIECNSAPLFQGCQKRCVCVGGGRISSQVS